VSVTNDIGAYTLVFLAAKQSQEIDINIKNSPVTSMATDYLKQHTRALHVQLDNLPLLVALASRQLDREQYHQCLSCFYQAYSVIETTLISSPQNKQPALAYQARLSNLRHELMQLGMPIPGSHDVPQLQISTAAHYWGARYVLEGSALGAKFLLPKIQLSLELSSPETLIFFSQLSQLANSWPEVITHINQIIILDNQKKEALAAAKKTFEIFHSHFSIKE
jgi:heme oxygenase (biliverdin-IX-beta and delta-forming)